MIYLLLYQFSDEATEHRSQDKETCNVKGNVFA